MAGRGPQGHRPRDRDVTALRRVTEVEAVRTGGPGGQHRNRAATGVRLRHGPSGIVVTATERRSRAANLKIAFARLSRRLAERSRTPRPRLRTRPPRAAEERRLQHKRRRAATKRLRRPPRGED